MEDHGFGALEDPALTVPGCSFQAVQPLFFSSQISHFKIPHYVVFVSQYPLTVSGKVRGGWGRAGTLGILSQLLSESLSLLSALYSRFRNTS